MLKAPMAERQAKARELLKQSGYDGKPIVLLHATNIHVMNQTMLVVAQNLRQVGFNVQLASTDWGAVVTRRSNQNPPEQGGWNVFYTWSGGNATSSPISLFAHAAIGKKAWFGWPTSERIEQLRLDWFNATSLEAQKKICSELQLQVFEDVPYVPLGATYQVSALRKGWVDFQEQMPLFYTLRKA